MNRFSSLRADPSGPFPQQPQAILLCLAALSTSPIASAQSPTPPPATAQSPTNTQRPGTNDLATTILSAFFRGDRERATAELSNALLRTPNDSRLWTVSGMIECANQRWDRGLQAAGKAIELNPKSAEAYLVRATANIGLNRLDDALKAHDDAIIATPSSPNGYLQRASFVLRHKPQPEFLRKALTDIATARGFGARSDVTDTLSGSAYVKLGELKTAEEKLRAALASNPGNSDAVRELVTLQQSATNTSSARQILESYRPLATSNIARIQLLLLDARQAVLENKPDIADRNYAQYSRIAPTDIAVVIEYTGWLESQNRTRDSIPLLEASIRRFPNSGPIAAQLAWAYADTETNLQEARRLLALAQIVLSNLPQLADTEGWIEFKAGDYKRALEKIAPALPLAPKVPEIAYHIGAIHQKLGNAADAKKFLRMALENPAPFNHRAAAEKLLTELGDTPPPRKP